MIMITQVKNTDATYVPHTLVSFDNYSENIQGGSRLSIPYHLRPIIPERLKEGQSIPRMLFPETAAGRPFDVIYDAQRRTTLFRIVAAGWNSSNRVVGLMDVENGIFEVSLLKRDDEKMSNAPIVQTIPNGNWSVKFKIDNPRTDRINWNLQDGILSIEIYVSKVEEKIKHPSMVAIPPGVPWNKQIHTQILQDNAGQRRWTHFQGDRQSGKSTWLTSYISQTLDNLNGERMILVFGKQKNIDYHKELLNKAGCNFRGGVIDNYCLPGGGRVEFMTYDKFLKTSLSAAIIVVDEIEWCDAEDKILACMCEGSQIVSTGGQQLRSMLNALEYPLEKGWSLT